MCIFKSYFQLVTVLVAFSSVDAGCGGRCGRRQNKLEEADINGVLLNTPQDDQLVAAGDPAAAGAGGNGKRKRCCPYEFDSSRCKEIDDRVLCGFNKNMGWPPGIGMGRELSNGCRLRGGRLECGYVEGPFTNPRRPPGWDNPNHSKSSESKDSSENKPDNNHDGKVQETSENVEKLKNIKHKPQKKKKREPERDCKEIGDRIVCKPRSK